MTWTNSDPSFASVSLIERCEKAYEIATYSHWSSIIMKDPISQNARNNCRWMTIALLTLCNRNLKLRAFQRGRWLAGWCTQYIRKAVWRLEFSRYRMPALGLGCSQWGSVARNRARPSYRLKTPINWRGLSKHHRAACTSRWPSRIISIDSFSATTMMVSAFIFRRIGRRLSWWCSKQDFVL